MSNNKSFYFVLTILFLLSIFTPSSFAERNATRLSKGQTIYVPAYSHIYFGNTERPFFLTITVSIRNVDPKHTIDIAKVDYFETQGTLLKEYLDKPITLEPLESLRYIVPENDKSGGSGANFIVEWKSERAVNPPIVESIMIGTQTQQGVSFTSRGQEILSND